MINFVTGQDQGYDLFVNEAYMKTGVVYAPKLVHTGSFDVEQYLAFAKPGFKFEQIEEFYSKLDLPDKTTKLFEIELEQLLLIHYLTNLLIDATHTILELPEIDFSEQFISKFKFIVNHYDEREITIVTNNPEIIDRLSVLNGQMPMMLPTYTRKVSRREIIGSFLGGKLLILSSLIISIMIISFVVTVDNKIVGEYSSYLQIPTDMIFIHNQASECDFNQGYYTVSSDQCVNSEPITYSQIEQLLDDENIESLAFDDKANLAELDEQINDNKNVTASVPDLNFDAVNSFTALPCINEESTPAAITCEPYNPDNSVISVVNADNRDRLLANVNNSLDISPTFILIKSSNTDELAATIAKQFPSINIYTKHSTQNYISKSNSKLIRNSVITSTLLSLVSVFILNVLISQLKLYLRGHKYLLTYQTLKPRLINRFYYGAQLSYFTTLLVLGNIITFNTLHSRSALILGLYLGILNSILWILCSDLNGRNFREEDHNLMHVVKKYLKNK